MIKTPEQIALEKLQARLTKRFHKACADYGLIADGDHILIGLSGGKDSLALTELLGRRSKIYKPRFRVTALHVRVKERDYQTDLSYLEDFCKEAGVELIVRDTMIDDKMSATASLNDGMVGKLKDESQKSRVESNPCFLCSWYRRKVLFNVAQELGCNKIAFGHHRDDIAATTHSFCHTHAIRFNIITHKSHKTAGSAPACLYLIKQKKHFFSVT